MSSRPIALVAAIALALAATAPAVSSGDHSSDFERSFAAESARHAAAVAQAKSATEREKLFRDWWPAVQRAVVSCNVGDSIPRRFFWSELAWRFPDMPELKTHFHIQGDLNEAKSIDSPVKIVIDGDCLADLTLGNEAIVHILGDLMASLTAGSHSEIVIGGRVDPNAQLRIKGASDVFVAGEFAGQFDGGCNGIWVGGDLTGQVKGSTGELNVWGQCQGSPSCYQLSVHSELSKEQVARIMTEENPHMLTWIRSSDAPAGVYSSAKGFGLIAIMRTSSEAVDKDSGVEKQPEPAQKQPIGDDPRRAPPSVVDARWSHLIACALRFTARNDFAFHRLANELSTVHYSVDGVSRLYEKIRKVDGDLETPYGLTDSRYLYIAGNCRSRVIIPGDGTLFVAGDVDGTIEIRGAGECIIGGSVSKQSTIHMSKDAALYVGGNMAGLVELQGNSRIRFDGDVDGVVKTGGEFNVVHIGGSLNGSLEPVDPEHKSFMALIAHGSMPGSRIDELATKYNHSFKASIRQSDLPAGLYPNPLSTPRTLSRMWVILQDQRGQKAIGQRTPE